MTFKNGTLASVLEILTYKVVDEPHSLFQP